jgi:hypothetical protein
MAEGAETLTTEGAAGLLRARRNGTFGVARDRALRATKIGGQRFPHSACLDWVRARLAARRARVAVA